MTADSNPPDSPSGRKPMKVRTLDLRWLRKPGDDIEAMVDRRARQILCRRRSRYS